MNQANHDIGTRQPGDDNQISTQKYCYVSKTGVMGIHKKPEPFIKGPIPLDWINRAAGLPGKALNVALAIRWLSDMNNNRPIKITKIAMQEFCFSKDAATDAIKRLEADGLVSVARRPGQKSLITLQSSKTAKPQ